MLREDGHDIVYAGVGRKNALGTRRLERVLGRERVRLVPDLNDPAEVARIAAAKPDLLVSWYFPKNVPGAVRALSARGSVGIHPSLLPRHRGPDPFFWAIAAGDTTTGVTAHRLADEYDTGAILARRELAIDPRWSAWTLAKKLDRPSLALLRDVVGKLVRGEPIREEAQDDRAATAAPEPSDDELEIDWNQPTEVLLRRIRAASPWPGTFTFLGDDAVTITVAEPAPSFPRVLAPGEAFVVDGKAGLDGKGARLAAVRSADGAVALLRGRIPADDEERDVGIEDLVDLVEKLKGLP